ncbi:hypothetical protein BN12_980001 [Nostocoides japonicum T1-X7]|uniref:CHAT domain-containing protein n=2 Tax=Nostocoides japonicum TaxID=99481 RepID=A0A077M8Y9_9MICO|nr:hypothetical protein BN12_980001 [Tetrasphaera japonica T1-X7]
MRAARAGLRAVHRRQAVLGATDLRVSTARYGERLGALGVSLALDGGHPRTVFAWAERSRAGSVVRRALPPEDPAYTAALVELRRRSHDLVDAQLSGEPTAALRAAAARAERAVVAASRSAHGSGASSSDGEVSPSELVVALADRALVEYVRDGSELYAVAVVSGRWRLVPLGAVDPISRLADQVGFGLRRAASVREPGTVTLTGTAAGGRDGAGTGAVSAGEAGGSGGVDAAGEEGAREGLRSDSISGEGDGGGKARVASSGESGEIDQAGKARAASSVEAGGSGGVDAAGEEGAREGLRSDSMSGEGDRGGKARVASSGEAGGSGEVGEGLARVVRAGVDGATADAARLLEERLLGPLGDLGGRDLVVIPTGVLHSVAWGVLPRLEHRPVTVAPSARAWLRAQRAMPSRDRHARTVVVAGPGLPGAAKEVARLGVAYRAIGSSGRPTTTPERADTPWDTTAPARHTTEALDGTDATVHQVLLALDGADTAHIAAHGILRADNPQFSALELVDGPLTVYDLERLRTPPRLMVLPACRSGVHAVLAGDEVMGLVASLLAMGTADVIAPVAVVDDAATTEVMVALHERLRAGDRPDVALAAVRFAVSGASPTTRAAAAAFTCHGG